MKNDKTKTPLTDDQLRDANGGKYNFIGPDAITHFVCTHCNHSHPAPPVPKRCKICGRTEFEPRKG
ncbi:hypothetical protein LJC56_01455 [Christensenellaceae bacterium OttesenSCG-928-K19]|nr:hypothetical protein [Christensenellaceae bacterium OttesenSCG-928-K19]